MSMRQHLVRNVFAYSPAIARSSRHVPSLLFHEQYVKMYSLVHGSACQKFLLAVLTRHGRIALSDFALWSLKIDELL